VEHQSIRKIFDRSVKALSDTGKLDLTVLNGDGVNIVAKKGGQWIGYSGHKHQKGDKMLPIFDNAGNILDKELYESRFISERSFAWEDKFRRILVRYDLGFVQHWL